MSRNIVSFSGGKDSTAMLLMMLERGLPVDEVRFFDTGWEFPGMHDHINRVEAYTGLKIIKLHPSVPFEHEMIHRPVRVRKGAHKGEVRHGYGWPGPTNRWCTGTKNKVLYKDTPTDAIWYIGIAADEADRATRLSKKRCNVAFPLIDWQMTESDALKYCKDRGFTWTGLYDHLHRVSCFCCPLQRIGNLRMLRRHYPDLWQRMQELDRQMTPPRWFKDHAYLEDLDNRFAREEGMNNAQYKI